MYTHDTVLGKHGMTMGTCTYWTSLVPRTPRTVFDMLREQSKTRW